MQEVPCSQRRRVAAIQRQAALPQADARAGRAACMQAQSHTGICIFVAHGGGWSPLLPAPAWHREQVVGQGVGALATPWDAACSVTPAPPPPPLSLPPPPCATPLSYLAPHLLSRSPLPSLLCDVTVEGVGTAPLRLCGLCLSAPPELPDGPGLSVKVVGSRRAARSPSASAAPATWHAIGDVPAPGATADQRRAADARQSL